MKDFIRVLFVHVRRGLSFVGIDLYAFSDCKSMLGEPEANNWHRSIAFAPQDPLGFPLGFLVLLFYENTDFGTKYVHRNENGEAKICSFAGSDRCF